MPGVEQLTNLHSQVGLRHGLHNLVAGIEPIIHRHPFNVGSKQLDQMKGYFISYGADLVKQIFGAHISLLVYPHRNRYNVSVPATNATHG